MKLPRRNFLHLAASAAALPALSPIAWAQESYPTRPVRLLVGYAAGGPADTIARLMAQWLSERLGQQVVIENRVGAASNIAAEAVVRSPPDGCTLLWVTISNAVNATLYDKLSFDFNRDIVPIASITRSPGVMIGHNVPFALLHAICGLPEDKLRGLLDHLQTAEFLYSTRLFPDLQYTFRHSLTHAVAYSGVLHE